MNKTILSIILILSFSIFVGCATLDTFPENSSENYDEPEELKALIESDNPDYVIVDVRPSDAYKSGHIPTAINIPNGKTEEVENPPAKDKYIIVYCETGGRAQAAGKHMIENGYQYVFNWGGIGGWTYKLEKEDEEE